MHAPGRVGKGVGCMKECRGKKKRNGATYSDADPVEWSHQLFPEIPAATGAEVEMIATPFLRPFPLP